MRQLHTHAHGIHSDVYRTLAAFTNTTHHRHASTACSAHIQHQQHRQHRHPQLLGSAACSRVSAACAPPPKHTSTKHPDASRPTHDTLYTHHTTPHQHQPRRPLRHSPLHHPGLKRRRSQLSPYSAPCLHPLRAPNNIRLVPNNTPPTPSSHPQHPSSPPLILYPSIHAPQLTPPHIIINTSTPNNSPPPSSALLRPQRVVTRLSRIANRILHKKTLVACSNGNGGAGCSSFGDDFLPSAMLKH